MSGRQTGCQSDRGPDPVRYVAAALWRNPKGKDATTQSPLADQSSGDPKAASSAAERRGDVVRGGLQDLLTIVIRQAQELPRGDVAPGNRRAALGPSERTFLGAEVLRAGVDPVAPDTHRLTVRLDDHLLQVAILSQDLIDVPGLPGLGGLGEGRRIEGELACPSAALANSSGVASTLTYGAYIGDGKLDPKEIAVAETIGQNLISEFDSVDFRETCNLNDLPKFVDLVDLLKDVLDQEMKDILYKYLEEIAKADGTVSPGEQVLLKQLSIGFGVAIA